MQYMPPVLWLSNLGVSERSSLLAQVLGEYGGLGLTIPKHTFMHGSNASSYIMYNTSRDLNSVYLKYLKDAEKMMLDPAFSLSAIIYTELTDVEHEVRT
jgi:hypothetical protein